MALALLLIKTMSTGIRIAIDMVPGAGGGVSIGKLDAQRSIHPLAACASIERQERPSSLARRRRSHQATYAWPSYHVPVYSGTSLCIRIHEIHCILVFPDAS